jgi:subfamily B ATP-binding cassette protein HlyB/CyaB
MLLGRVSQPVLRIVGLWQQFMQAKKSMARLCVVMDAPGEPYSAIPGRSAERKGEIKFSDVGFSVRQKLTLSLSELQFLRAAGYACCGDGTIRIGKKYANQATNGVLLSDRWKYAN